MQGGSRRRSGRGRGGRGTIAVEGDKREGNGEERIYGEGGNGKR